MVTARDASSVKTERSLQPDDAPSHQLTSPRETAFDVASPRRASSPAVVSARAFGDTSCFECALESRLCALAFAEKF
jgi:hypothetical protein